MCVLGWATVSGRSKNQGNDQWITVAVAVKHMVETYESYRILGSEHQSQLRAFQDLHESMGAGDVEVRGALLVSSNKNDRLSPRLCRKLRPSIAESTIGSVYNLIDPNPDPPAIKTEGSYGKGEVRWQGQGVYTDLRVSSRDLYKFWPKTSKHLEDTEKLSSEERKAPITETKGKNVSTRWYDKLDKESQEGIGLILAWLVLPTIGLVGILIPITVLIGFIVLMIYLLF